MSAAFSYSVGDIRCRHPVVDVWVASPHELNASKREYASDRGIPESCVWIEANKSPAGPISRLTLAAAA
jgi:hypothetical protein